MSITCSIKITEPQSGYGVTLERDIPIFSKKRQKADSAYQKVQEKKSNSSSKNGSLKKAVVVGSAIGAAGAAGYIAHRYLLQKEETLLDKMARFETMKPQEKRQFYSDMTKCIETITPLEMISYLEKVPASCRKNSTIRRIIEQMAGEFLALSSEDPEKQHALLVMQENFPEVFSDKKVLDRMLIECGQDPNFFEELREIELNSAAALYLLDNINMQNIVVSDATVQFLVNATKNSPDTLLESISVKTENISLLAQLIKVVPQELQEKSLKDLLYAFCQNGQFVLATELATKLLPQFQKNQKQASFLSGVLVQLQYLMQYLYWYSVHYDSSLHFEGADKESLKKILESDEAVDIRQELHKLFSGTVVEAVRKVAGTTELLSVGGDDPLKEDIEWLYSKKLPLTLAQEAGFVSFLKKTKLHTFCRYYGHLLKDATILVDGVKVAFSEIEKRFEVVDGVHDIEIIEKSTKKRFTYLENGLTKHNPEKSERAFKHIDRSKESDPKHLITFFFLDEGHTNSLSGIKRLKQHAWVNLTTPNGAVKSFGSLSSNIIRSPDIYEYMPYKRKSVTFDITSQEYKKLLSHIKRRQAKDTQAFNFLTSNCSSFSGQVASTLFPDISATMSVQGFNTFESKIKAFVIARELAKLFIQNKNVIQVYLKKASTSDAGKISQLLISEVQKVDMQKEAVEFIQALFVNQETIELFDHLLRSVSKTIAYETEHSLQNKLFNLVQDLFFASKNLSIDAPHILYERLQHQKSS